MTADLYDGFLMVTMGATLLLLGAMTIAQSWKQGNFVAISAAVSMFFLGISALIEQILGSMTYSMIALGCAIAVFLFTLFVVAPMAFRRSKKKRPA